MEGILLQAPTGATNIINIILFASMFLVFYFFLIRPQVKKAKDQQNFVNALAKGDKIVTSGGIYGKIVGLSSQHATVEIAPKTRIKVAISAISMELTQAGASGGDSSDSKAIESSNSNGDV